MASYEGDEGATELVYFESIDCESCRELDKAVMKEEYDDEDYLYSDDEFEGNETLKLHVINYRRKRLVNGCFDVDCPPDYDYSVQLPHSGKHYGYVPGFQEAVQDCANYAVETYNEETNRNLELVKVENVAAEGSGWWRFYLTIRCSHGGESDSDETYRTLVSCCWWNKEDKQVLVFRDSNGKNLLEPPEPYFDEFTKPKERRPLPVDTKSLRADGN